MSASGLFCAQCATRFVLLNGACKKVSDQCNTWDLNGACTTCYNGYALVGIDCVIGQSSQGTRATTTSTTTSISASTAVTTIANCAQASTDGLSCIKCSYRFYFNAKSKSCDKVSDQCKDWSSINGACTQCYDGYILNGADCLLNATVYLPTPAGSSIKYVELAPNCAEMSADGKFCKKCSYRYWASASGCLKVSD